MSEIVEPARGAPEPEHIAAAQELWYGHRKLRKLSELELCWKAAKVVAAGDAALNDDERTALIGRMCATGTPDAVIVSVMNWDEWLETPAELLAHLDLAEEERLELGLWIVYEGLSAAFADGDLALGERKRVYELAATLGVPSTTVDALVSVCRDEALLRARRIKTLQGRIAVPPSQESPRAEPYELIPATVRAADVRRVG